MITKFPLVVTFDIKMDMDLQDLESDSVSTMNDLDAVISHEQLLSNREALEKRLSLRRPREELVNQGIMPAATASPKILSQKAKLERAKTGDILQKKIRVRPQRSNLVQRHILHDTTGTVDPSLIDRQIRLKRKKLEDDLNDKLIQRPGPLELVKENILECEEPVAQAVKEGSVPFTETAEFLEPVSPDSLNGSPDPSSDVQTVLQPPHPHQIQMPTLQAPQHQYPLPHQVPPQQLQHHPKRESRSRKKPPKPKFRKYKYHEYRPPNGEVEKNELPEDSPYALLLQQQQMYLQLQVLSQNYPGQFILPSIPEAAKLNLNNNSQEQEKPMKIEDMRVVDMRKELKNRGLPVSGSKTDLMERLKVALAQDNQVPPLLSSSNPTSPSSSVMGTSSPCSPDPQPLSVSSPSCTQTLSAPSHFGLTRSNSVPTVSLSQTQQMHMQLMSQNPNYQQTQSDQQRQHRQFLNIQLQLQQLSIQQQQQQQQNARKLTKTLSGPDEICSKLSSEQQNVMMGLQQGQQQFSSSLQNHITTSSVSLAAAIQQQSQQTGPVSVSQMTPFSKQLQIHQQQLQSSQQSQVQSSHHNQAVYNIGQEMHLQSVSQSQKESQGLVSLREQAEMLENRSQMPPVVNSNGGSSVTFSWQYQQQKQHPLFNGESDTQPQQPRSPDQPVFAMSPPQPDQHCRPTTPDLSQMNGMSVKTETQFQRSYSERGPCEIPDRAFLSPPTFQTKPRSNSEPGHVFTHKRSVSFPNTPMFRQQNPPPSYEAHMQLQKQHSMELLSHSPVGNEFRFDPQQIAPKAEKLDAVMQQCDRDSQLTQELKQAMMKQQMAFDQDELLEIIGDAISGQSTKSPTRVSPTPATTSSPQGVPSSRFPAHSPLSQSPSCGYLSVHSPSSGHQLPGRISRSCEDVSSMNFNGKFSPQYDSHSNNSLDIDTMLLSPGSPVKMDGCCSEPEDNMGSLPQTGRGIPIPMSSVAPSRTSDNLGWLDLSSSPCITNMSPCIQQTVQAGREPPQFLYEPTTFRTEEPFSLSLFDLETPTALHAPNELPESMDYCV